MATNKISAVVEAPVTEGQVLSPEGHIANLKAQSNMLIEDTAELRVQIHNLHKLNLKIITFSADHDILSSRFLDAVARSTAEMAAATETAEKMLKRAELATAEINAVEMRLLVDATEKDGIVRDLKVAAEERDLGRSDLDVKRKELTDLEDQLTHALKEREVADVKCDMLDILKADNKKKTVKISALKERIRFLEDCKGKLEKKVEELNERWRIAK